MGHHLIDGEFQSDKYPTTPRGKVPLSCKDPTAQDLLWEYARRRRQVDAEFSDDLMEALRLQGFDGAGMIYDGPTRSALIDKCIAAVRLAGWCHAGEDSYSQGMDAGARHQVKACIEALEALKAKGPADHG